jgi:chromosome segregation ATPase
MNNALRWGLPALLAAAAVVAGLQWAAASRQKAALETRAAALEKEKRDAELRAAQALSAAEALRAQLLEKGIEPLPEERLKRPDAGAAARAEAVRELARAQTQLQAAEASIRDLQARVRGLEDALEKAQQESARLSAAEAELRETVDRAHRLVRATEAELKSKTERLLQAETAARVAQQDAAAAKARAAQVTPVLRELEEINRRRENYLTSLQRRYRDLTDQLRSLAVRMETQRDSPAAAAPDVSRIQSTVQSAEDDLRQIQTLNAQAQRAAARLEAK